MENLKELTDKEMKIIQGGGPIGDFAEKLGANIIDVAVPIAIALVTRRIPLKFW